MISIPAREDAGAAKALEAKHGPNNPLDHSRVLLDEVVFRYLAWRDVPRSMLMACSAPVRPAFVDHGGHRFTVASDRTGKESSSDCLVT
jgi:hypothetical protein